ncbi:hypothetical protein [Nitrosococcus watsonii]|uniref:Uncharacterized protein n=1 Tax=Nitrosococcus watsoni (strain C-113) TaxID=105559 RepID=D8K563_NITWC|nr:hypothetical protein [Nitrosococcus watsonii]ADJ28040.1 hypothetical protein Nwat_1106 [Nitrosococcus watsonii C-113]
MVPLLSHVIIFDDASFPSQRRSGGYDSYFYYLGFILEPLRGAPIIAGEEVVSAIFIFVNKIYKNQILIYKNTADAVF